MGHGRFPQSRFLPLDNGCGRAVPARGGRYGPGASDARRSAVAAAADPSRSPHAARTAREVRREMLQLKGTWTSMQTVESTVNGVPQKPKQFKMVWSIDRDLITGTGDDGFADKTFRYTPDPHKTPKTLDLTLLNNGLTLFGIYKLDGDELTVCMSASERPTDFEARPYRILRNFTGKAAHRLNWPRSARTPRAAFGPSNRRAPFQGRRTPAGSI